MQHIIIDRPKIIICLLSLMGLLGAGAPISAREIQVDGLACNDLCQAWLGYTGHDGITGPTIETSKSRDQRSTLPSRPTRSASPSVRRPPEEETAKVDRIHPVARRSAPKVPETTVAAKHARLRNREARSGVPLPAMPSGRPASAASGPLPAASRSPAGPRGLDEAAALPDAGTKPPASIDRASPPLPPDRPALPDASKSSKGPSRTAAPTAAVAPPSPGAVSPPPIPNLVEAATLDDGAEPSPDARAVPPIPISAGAGDRPNDQAPSPSKPAASPPSTVVATLPSPAHAGSGPRIDVHPSGSTQEGRLQPVPELAGTPLRVTVGQISAEPRGTDVHVVLVNVLQREMKDVDIRCRAHDAQGLQVAEASAHIASIAPSDVAFGQVLFPAEITAQDNTFTCDVGRIAAADGVTP